MSGERKIICDFCNARHLMKKIMNSIEELPEFNVPLYDDAVSEVFNSADNAFNILQCYCNDKQYIEAMVNTNKDEHGTARA